MKGLSEVSAAGACSGLSVALSKSVAARLPGGAHRPLPADRSLMLCSPLLPPVPSTTGSTGVLSRIWQAEADLTAAVRSAVSDVFRSDAQ